MWSRLAILGGLLAGIAVAALVLGGILVLAPDPVSTPTPLPTIALTPAPTVAPTPVPTAAPTASRSAAPAPSEPAPDGSDFVGGDQAALPGP